MSIYYDPDKFLLKRFNENNGFALYPEHVAFNNPRATAIVDPAMADRYNTIIDVVMLPGSMYDGVTQLYYNRINLSYEFSTSRLQDLNYLSIGKEKTVHEIIPRLNRKFGLALTVDEVVDAPIRDAGLFTLVNIKVLPTSRRYYGSFDINVMRASGGLKVMDIKHQAIWEWDASRKIYATKHGELPLYSINYNIDYTPIAQFLKTIIPSDTYFRYASETEYTTIPKDPWISQMLNSVDNLGWTTTGSAGTPQDLYLAAIIYNGPTKDCKVAQRAFNNSRPIDGIFSNPANLEFDNVLVLVPINPNYSGTRYKSLVLFHYNEV